MNVDARNVTPNKMLMNSKMDKLSDMRSKAILGAVLMLFGGTSFMSYWFAQAVPLLVFGILLFLAGLIVELSISKNYKQEYKKLFVEGPLNQNFQYVVYDWKAGFTKEAVRSFGLTAIGNRFHSEDYIRAVFDGVPFEMSDVTVQDVRSTGKSTYTVTYFKGRMLVFDYPGKKVGTTRIYSDAFYYLPKDDITKNNKVEMESDKFNQIFRVYAEDPHDAFYLLTPQFMEKLDHLASNYTSIGIHFCGNKVFVGFNEPYNNAFDSKSMMNKLSYDEEMAKTQKEINDIKFIISMLREMPHLQQQPVQQPIQPQQPVQQQRSQQNIYNTNDYYTVV